MLRTLKWVYDLGVRQERVRIASHLQLEGQRAMIHRDTALDMLRDNADQKRPSKKRIERLDFAIAVNDRVQEIINNMFESKGDWVPGPSLMFPDEPEKK